MADDTNIILQAKDSELGEIRLTPNVLEIVASIAASEVDGVNRMLSSISNSFSDLIGRKKEGRGVKLTKVGDDLTVDISVYLNYGVSVPKVSIDIQQQVVQQVLFMTGLQIKEVNVHVQGVISEKMESTVDPNNPFANEENGDE